MGGFLKGLVVGVASFALGFAALSVLFPPETPVPAPVVANGAVDGADDAVPGLAPETDPEPADEPAPEPSAEPADEPAPPQAAIAPESPQAVVAASPVPEADEPGEPAVPADMPAPVESGTEVRQPDTAAPAAAPSPEVLAPAPADHPVPPAAAAGQPDETPPPAPETLPAWMPPAEAPPTETPPDEGARAGTGGADPAPGVLRAVPPPSGLGRAVEGVTVGRLPSIGGEPAAPAPAAETPPAEAAGPALPAWQRHAVSFEADPALPLFAVILLDPQADPAAEAALRAMPFPVAVALDPADPDAPRRAGLYRAAGHEIVLLATGIPVRATASDLEVTFSAWLMVLPEAVAVLDPPEGGFQGDRQLAQRIMPVLLGRERGLVTLDRGLNPAQQSARSAGVVQTTAFRVIDGQSENEFTIRRFLDRAVFRAQQEGRVAVIGHANRPETVAALLGWRLEGRAGQVALAPVSALLRPE